MKVCFVGIGSIGTRHLRNLVTICENRGIALEIHAFRESSRKINDELKCFIQKEIYEIDELDKNYDITFITNPTYKHYESIKLFKLRTKHMFIEKPIFDKSTYNIDSMIDLDNKSVYYIAAPLRYTDVIQEIKTIIENESIYSARIICSSYLPDWRPGVDYRNIYSAHREQGGGVSIDCIHELDYIVYLFGFPDEVINARGTYSHLEINSDDLSVYIFIYKDRLVELHLDYFGREKKREIELIGRNGSIIGDLNRGEIRFSNKETISYQGNINNMYLKELEHFMDLIEGKKINDNDIIHANRVLKLSEGE